MVGIKGCVTSSSSKGHYPPLGFNSKLSEMHLMTIPKFELGIIASRGTPHHCLKQYSSKPSGKMFACNLKTFANVLELLDLKQTSILTFKEHVENIQREKVKRELE